jgi:tryptophan-rich sensory protein
MALTGSARHHPGRHPARHHRPAHWALLGLSLVAVAVVAGVGGLATSTGVDSWYRTVDTPPWNPPDAVFGPVWTVLYVAMAVAAWLVAREGIALRAVRVALGTYAVQLGLNLAWTLVFFGAESPEGGLVVIAALLVAIVLTIWRFAPLSRLAAALLVPYLAWVVFAASLNVAIAVLN